MKWWLQYISNASARVGDAYVIKGVRHQKLYRTDLTTDRDEGGENFKTKILKTKMLKTKILKRNF